MYNVNVNKLILCNLTGDNLTLFEKFQNRFSSHVHFVQ